MTERYLTTTEASVWLADHYDMPIPAHMLRRMARAGKLKTYKPHDDSWYRFTRETLASLAEARGFTRVS